MAAMGVIRRLVPRYSLRTLLVALTLACLACGFWMNGSLRQRAAVRYLVALNAAHRRVPVGGGMWGGGGGPAEGIDMQVLAYRAQGRDDHHRPDIPWWQRPVAAVLGEEACGEVTGVQLMQLPATDGDLQYVARLPSIERINLLGTEVTDAGLVHLRSCPLLTFISLEDTAISDAGLVHLAVHQRLEGLSLSGTKITDAGLARLAKLKQLKQLWLGKTAITNDGYKQLTAALPDCDIQADVAAARRPHWGGGSLGGAAK